MVKTSMNGWVVAVFVDTHGQIYGQHLAVFMVLHQQLCQCIHHCHSPMKFKISNKVRTVDMYGIHGEKRLVYGF